jgi:hypothetical protein
VWLVERQHVGEEWVRHLGAVRDKLISRSTWKPVNAVAYLRGGVYLDDFKGGEGSSPVSRRNSRLVADNQRRRDTIAGLQQVVTDKTRELRSTAGRGASWRNRLCLRMAALVSRFSSSSLMRLSVRSQRHAFLHLRLRRAVGGYCCAA